MNTDDHPDHDVVVPPSPPPPAVPGFFAPLATTRETLGRAGNLYLRSGTARTFVQLALVLVVPATAVVVTVASALATHHDDDDGGNSWWDGFARTVAVLASGSLLQRTLGMVSDGAIALAVADLVLERTPSWHGCLRRAVANAGTLVCAGIAAWFLTYLGFFCGIFPGVLCRIHFASLVPLIVLEDARGRGTVAVLRRSWHLASGHRWHVLKCLASLTVLYWLADGMLRKLLATMHRSGGDDDTEPVFLTKTFQLLKSIPATVIVPLQAILKTVLYLDLRVRKEGLTAQTFAQELDAASTGGGASLREPLLQNIHAVSSEEEIEFSSEQPEAPQAAAAAAEPPLSAQSQSLAPPAPPATDEGTTGNDAVESELV